MRRRRNSEEKGGSEVKVFEVWRIGVVVRVLWKTVTVAWMRRSERCGERGIGHGFGIWWIVSIETKALFVCDLRNEERKEQNREEK